ncbi:MAG: RNA methyltransferase [Candidatus Cloacimonetes bacterium]|nr:RNA methyltransferase [Candidatus Cloacimonadota bacterium]
MPENLTKDDKFGNIKVILIEPVYRGNVGSVARIMNNFEFTQLRIVGAIPQKEDFVVGVHSEDILHKAQLYDTLESALSDIDRVIVLSRRVGNTKKPDFSPRQLANYVCDKGNPGSPLNYGLVFGRETFGLLDTEVEQSDLRCYIPANEQFPSLNLAQAVVVILYEIYTAEPQQTADLAEKSVIDEAIEYSIEVLDSMTAFKNDNDKTYLTHFLSSLLYRSNATKQMTIDFKKVFNRIFLRFHRKGKGYKIN